MLASLFSDDRLLVFLSGLGLLALFFWYFATDFERKKRNIGTVLVALIAIFSFMSIIPKEKWGDILSGKESVVKASNLKGGIDLVGGSSFTLRVQPALDSAGNPLPVDKKAVEQAILTIEKRLNKSGANDLLIVAQGEDRILVQMPGVSPNEAKKVRIILEQIAKLEIKTVHPDNRVLADQVAKDPENEVVPGYELKVYKSIDEDGKETSENVLVTRRTPLDGSYVTHAQEQYGAYEGTLSVELNNDGAKLMYDLTSNMAIGRDRLATVLDGEVLNVATVQAVLSKKFQITGMNDAKEAKALASALLNPLQNPLLVEEERSVSATLGKETVYQGITAGIAGLGLTLVFVLLYYRMAGIIALIGLSLNILILFGTMAMFGFTFTLPGIAGIILTIGVAVDANVLIYERLREELSKGKSVKAAISAAYDKAFSAIFDANITTLITALILFWRASGTVKGFAVTLTIGILGTLIAALLCTRVMFWWGADKGIIKKLKFMDIIPKKAFDFLGMRKLAFTVSAVLMLAGLSTVLIKGKKCLGIDFTGGAQLSYQLLDDQHIPQPEVQELLNGLTALSKPASSQEETSTNGEELITVRCAEADTEIIENAMSAKYDILKDNPPSRETISASLGGDFLTTAVWALLIGLFGIMIYITIRFEFSFALGAFAALIHDIMICLGIVVLSGQQLTLIHVGAFLTIAGYSINDTIVVFDRIREDLKTKRGDVKDVMNTAINSTLSRTVLTSVTTFVAVLVLFIFGGSSLSAFSFTIMLGVIVGTYSSILIASPIVYIWSKVRGVNLRRELLDANLEAEVNPAKS